MAGPKRTSGLLAGSGRGSLLADFTTRLQSVVRSTEEAPPGGVGGWACQMGVALDRGLFSFSRHECLAEPYADNHPRQVEMKCAQMSTKSGQLHGPLLHASGSPRLIQTFFSHASSGP